MNKKSDTRYWVCCRDYTLSIPKYYNPEIFLFELLDDTYDCVIGDYARKGTALNHFNPQTGYTVVLNDHTHEIQLHAQMVLEYTNRYEDLKPSLETVAQSHLPKSIYIKYGNVLSEYVFDEKKSDNTMKVYRERSKL